MNNPTQQNAITIATLANSIALVCGTVNNLAGEDISTPDSNHDLAHDAAHELTLQLKGEV